jgi:DNA helicase HerA-like ATPase
MAEPLYLGKLYNPTDATLGERFLLDPADLTTHGIVIGMTGSGKTGLSVCLIEEALRARIPVIVIDPKGDMANLALAFRSLSPTDFEPWIDRDEAAREGRQLGDAAATTATTWIDGLAEWGLGPADVQAYAASRRVRVFTPGSKAGSPLNLLASMRAPATDFESDEEDYRDEIDGVVGSLLGFVGIEADPVTSREYILLFNLIERAWRQRQDMTLERLIGEVANPPLEKVGALPVDAFYPQKDRNALMFALNNLLASPAFEAWREGEPIDIEAWVRSEDGLAQLSIVYTAHLDDRERMAVTTQVLNRLKSWMRRQPGTSELRCLFYMDEIFGYFPPTAEPPSKRPLLTLLKQARAYGLGVLLSTQNPVDLDYKGLANMGFWAVGRLQTTQDQARVREGIEAALEDAGSLDFDGLIAGVEKRVFLIHDIHRPRPELVHSRWAMSYLRGPITRDEIRSLPGVVFESTPTERDPEPPAAATNGCATAASPSPSAKAATPATSGPPLLPGGLAARYLDRNGGSIASPHIGVGVNYRLKYGTQLGPEHVRYLAFPLRADMAPGELLEGQPIEVAAEKLTDSPPSPLEHGPLPLPVSKDGSKAIDRALRDRLDDRLATEVLFDPVTKEWAEPGEGAALFSLRLGESPKVQQRVAEMEAKVDRKRAELARLRDDAGDRQADRWTDFGTSILSGVFGGRRRRPSLRSSRADQAAERRVEALEADLAELERQALEAARIDESRFERRVIKPTRTEISITRSELLWVY